MRWMLCVPFLLIFAIAAPAAQVHDHAASMPAADGKFNPWIVSDGKAGFYIAYIDRSKGAPNVMLQHSANGTLSTPVRVNDRPGDAAVRNENPPKVAVGAAGELFVVWANERERWKGNIRFARSVDGGRTFSRAIDVNSGASQAPVGRAFGSVAVDGKGRIYVAWIDERNKTAATRGAEIWMAASNDGGRTFSADRKILSDVCECCRTTLAIDASGSVYLSYRRVPAAGPMLRDIAVARSDDGGKTFASTIVHRDEWELNACPIAGATMTIDAANRLHIVWFTEYQGTPRLLYSSSDNKGRTFAPPQTVDPNQKLAKHAHLVPFAGNRLAIAWDDTESGQSVVKWGLLDSRGPVRLLGSRRAASYPVIAATEKAIEVVALAPEGKEIVRVFATGM